MHDSQDYSPKTPMSSGGILDFRKIAGSLIETGSRVPQLPISRPGIPQPPIKHEPEHFPLRSLQKITHRRRTIEGEVSKACSY